MKDRRKKRRRLPEMTAKRYAALAVYIDNLPKKPKTLRHFARMAQDDVVGLRKYQRAHEGAFQSEQGGDDAS